MTSDLKRAVIPRQALLLAVTGVLVSGCIGSVSKSQPNQAVRGAEDRAKGRPMPECGAGPHEPEHPLPCASVGLSEEQFWQMLEETRRASGGAGKVQAKLLEDALIQRGKPAVIDFQNHLRRHMAELSNFEVLAANFIIVSYTSDNAFEEFRAWLVCQGRERYEWAKQDVSTIAAWLDREDVARMGCESLLMAAYYAWEELETQDEALFDRVARVHDPEFEEDWPEDKAGFEAHWPELVRKFWNQERIDKIHNN